MEQITTFKLPVVVFEDQVRSCRSGKNLPTYFPSSLILTRQTQTWTWLKRFSLLHLEGVDEYRSDLLNPRRRLWEDHCFLPLWSMARGCASAPAWPIWRWPAGCCRHIPVSSGCHWESRGNVHSPAHWSMAQPPEWGTAPTRAPAAEWRSGRNRIMWATVSGVPLWTLPTDIH